MEIESAFSLLHPFSLIISGISQSGKTRWFETLLNSMSLINPTPVRIIISYTEDQQVYHDIVQRNPRIELTRGLDFELSDFDSSCPSLIVIDDQMEKVQKEEKIQTLFTKGIHHKSISVILITQNLYPQGKHSRDIRLNSHYLVIMKSPTFASQVNYLGRQLFPKTPCFLPDAYKRATEKPYSYLFINLHPLCPDNSRVLQGIFSNELKFVYLPK
jgi:hypothetical protein